MEKLKKYIIMVVLCLVIITSFIILFTSNVAAKIIYVDDSGGQDYTKIQDAITDADDSDTIFVYSGTYNENIIVNKILTLEGEDKTNTIIDGVGGEKVIYVTVDNVNITGFTAQNGEEFGIHLYYGDFITISNNTLLDNQKAIYLEESNNNTITNNQCTSPRMGIELDSSDYNNIGNNICNSYEDAIYLDYSNNCTVANNTCSSDHETGISNFYGDNNTFSYNKCLNNGKEGMQIVFSNNIKIINNICKENTRAGIEIDKSNNVSLENNNCSNNNIGVQLDTSANITFNKNICNSNIEAGIYTERLENTTIANNIFNSNDKKGIYLNADNIKIFNNICNSNDEVGIFIRNSNRNHFNNITCNLNKDLGVKFESFSKNNTFTNSTITKNTNFDIYLEDNSFNNAINTTFETIFVELGSKFEVKWYFNINVINAFGNPIIGANVIIKDINENVTCNKTTDTEGFVKWIECLEYKQITPSDKIYFTPHTIYINKEEIGSETINLTINESKTLRIILGATPELAVYSSDIIFSNDMANEGESITIRAVIRNLGDISVSNVIVRFLDNDNIIENKEISVDANSFNFTSILIQFQRGNHDIRVVIDPNEEIYERNKNNNEAKKSITVFYFSLDINCSNNKSSTEPGKIAKYDIKITNLGSRGDTIFLEVFSSNNWKTYLNKSAVLLPPQITSNVTLTVIPPSDAKVEEWAVTTVKAISQGNTSIFNFVTTNTTIKKVQSVSLFVDSYEKIINPGEDVKYILTVENTGNCKEAFNLSVNLSSSSIPQGWNIEPLSFEETIEPNESFTKTFTISAPLFEKAEEQARVTFEAKPKGTKFSDSVITTTTAQQYFNVMLSVTPSTLEIIPEESKKISITVINYGNGEDIIDLVMFGINPDWASLDKTTVTLNSNNYTNVIMNVTAPKNALENEKAVIQIYAISKNGMLSNIVTTTTIVKVPSQKNKPPIAKIEITLENKSIDKARIGEKIKLDASLSSDEDGSIVEYKWELGNGEIRYGKIVNYIYPQGTDLGSNLIVLTVKDDKGEISSTSKNFTVLKSVISESIEDETNDESWLLYLILIIVVIMVILILLMFLKMKTTLWAISKKEGRSTPEFKTMPTDSDALIKEEELKKNEMEIWKPPGKKETLEPSLITKEKAKEEKEMINESKDSEELREDLSMPNNLEETNYLEESEIKEQKVMKEDFLEKGESKGTTEKENEKIEKEDDWWKKWEEE